MCGIAGFIDLSLEKTKAENVIEEMLLAIKHRGPDHTGFQIYEDGLVLGHNRLSIIDLSKVGNQPFENKHLSITYNGEIYNFKEIRKELEELGHRFRSETDTEVILAAFEEWGEKCVERFLGMWAFAIWDKERRELFCSRDRLGIKPFFYTWIRGCFYFASEIKALKKVADFDPSMDEDMVNMYLHMSWNTFGEKTCYRNVFQIEQATNLVLKDGVVIRKNRYWDLDVKKRIEGISEEEAIKGFKELFEDSIRLHMRSDVPVGALLSGGIDSSSIVSTVAALYPEVNLDTFSIYYTSERGMDERPFIDAVAAKYQNIHSEQKEPLEEEILGRMKYFFEDQDLPLLGSGFISNFLVLEMAKKKGLKVLLDGQGADEYLVGYLRSFFRIVSQNPLSIKKWRMFRSHLDREGYGMKERIQRLIKVGVSVVLNDQRMHGIEYKIGRSFVGRRKNLPFKLPAFKGEKLNEFLYNLLFYTELPRNLYYADLYSMYFSIECRVPFLDHRLIEYVFALPDELKTKEGITKYILREAVKEYIPEEVYYRKDKKGFVTPGEVRWLRGSLSGEVVPSGVNFLDSSKEKRVLEEYKEGKNKDAGLVWRLIFLRRWREYLHIHQ
jgi:asparagine synthase (glutamine-hydrolysing)